MDMEQEQMMMNQQMCMAYYQHMMEMQMYLMDPCNQVQQKPNNNRDYKFNESFLRAEDYEDQRDIIEHLPHLKGFNVDMDIAKVGNATFFIVRSTNDDDIHKAIKYQVWASSVKNNQVLNEAYRAAAAQGHKVFLFFSVVKSGQFCAVAEMKSPLQVDYSFRFWWEENKYFGTFKLKFVFIKDVKDRLFEHIREESQDNNPVYKLRDSTRLSIFNGKKMLAIFMAAPNRPNIFETFAYMDKREDIKRTQRGCDANATMEFNEKAAQYRETQGNPLAFKKRPINFNSNGLYGNPFYYKQQPVSTPAPLENNFLLKDKNKDKTKTTKKHKRNHKPRENHYQAGKHGLETVVVNYTDSENEPELPANDNLSRPVVEQTPEQE